MFEFLLKKGFGLELIFFEYAELFITFYFLYLLYRFGRVGLSLAIYALCQSVRLIFDHAWLFIVFKLESSLRLILWYQGFSFSCFFLLFATLLFLQLCKKPLCHYATSSSCNLSDELI